MVDVPSLLKFNLIVFVDFLPPPPPPLQRTTAKENEIGFLSLTSCYIGRLPIYSSNFDMNLLGQVEYGSSLCQLPIKKNKVLLLSGWYSFLFRVEGGGGGGCCLCSLYDGCLEG